MSEELTLLPCPACKRHSAGITRTNGTGVAFVMCRYIGCALSGPIRKTDEAAVAAWNAMPRDLTWTDAPPKEPGWYWCRDEKGKIRLHQLENFVGGPRLFVCGISKHIFPDELTDRQWTGPIPEPREPLNS